MLEESLQNPDHLRRCFNEADAVLIAVGHGFSRLAGFDPYSDPSWFRREFRDFRSRHGLRSIYDGLVFHYPSLTMEWAFMGRLIAHLSEQDANGNEAFRLLVKIAARKPSFIITTNIDGWLAAADLDQSRLFEVGGNLAKMVCRWHCCPDALAVDEAVHTMLAPGPSPSIAVEHLPRCHRCNGPMTVAIARSPRFSRRPDQTLQRHRMLTFLHIHRSDRLLVLELGVSPWNTCLKGIAVHVAQQNPRSTYLVVSDQAGYLPPALYRRSAVLTDGIPRVLAALIG